MHRTLYLIAMRKVSAKELARLKRKGGVHVKRRLGTKKPGPEVDDASALSGAKVAEIPTPASPLPAAPPASPTIDMNDYRRMAASNALRDAQLEKIVTNNTKVIKDFATELTEQQSSVGKRVSWDHEIIRDTKTGLIKMIRSTPLER